MTATPPLVGTIDPETRPPDAPVEVRPRPPVGRAGLGGLVAGAFGLAVAHLLTGLDRDFRDPAVSVGDRTIDRVPKFLREWAIDTFGTSDKDVLLIGIYLTLGIGAVLAGIAYFRGRRRGALVGVGVLGLLGAWAGMASPVLGWGGALPILGGAVAAAGALVALGRVVQPSGRALAADEERRRFLVGAGGAVLATMAIAGLGRALRDRFGVAAERLGLALPRARSPLPVAPVGLEAEVPAVSPLFTPNRDFYRIDTALFVPNVSAASWQLRIHGRVEREVTITYDDLVARDLIETDVTIACVSNEVGGDLVGNARWLGCRLDDLLAEAGIRPEADQIVGRSVDGWTSGFPVDVLDGRDAIVAIAMNGEPLPVQHGYPARLIVPGLYGYVSATKWLSEIELTRFDEFSAYWIPRGWAARAPIKTQSRIDTPRDRIAPGRVAIAGVAWAGVRAISRVEVLVEGPNDPGTWVEANLGPEVARTTWRQWWLPWDATPGQHFLTVRATDGDGVTQIETLGSPAPDGATGWHVRVVDVG